MNSKACTKLIRQPKILNKEDNYSQEKYIEIINNYYNANSIILPFDTGLLFESIGGDLNVDKYNNLYISDSLNIDCDQHKLEISKFERLNMICKMPKLIDKKIYLRLDGAVTLGMNIYESSYFIKNIIINKLAKEQIMKNILELLINFIDIAYDSGYRNFYLADPTGSVKIIGSRCFNQFSKQLYKQLLETIENKYDINLRICPILYNDLRNRMHLEEFDFIEKELYCLESEVEVNYDLCTQRPYDTI